MKLNVLEYRCLFQLLAVGNDHWWCYAINCQSRHSLGNRIVACKRLDKTVSDRPALNFGKWENQRCSNSISVHGEGL